MSKFLHLLTLGALSGAGWLYMQNQDLVNAASELQKKLEDVASKVAETQSKEQDIFSKTVDITHEKVEGRKKYVELKEITISEQEKKLFEIRAKVESIKSEREANIKRFQHEVTTFIAQHKDAINTADNGGVTAFMRLLETYHGEMRNNTYVVFIINELIRNGADIFAKDKDGRTPLIRAAWNSTAEVCKALIEAGADVNAKDNDGVTPLMFAARNITAEVVCKTLIEAGADVNAMNNNGMTPLMFAASYSTAEVCKMLIKAGAGVNVEDNGGWTPLRYASTEESRTVLIEAGGDVVGGGNTNGGMGDSRKLKSGFVGVFYDFKKKNDGGNSHLSGKSVYLNGEVLQIESLFVNKMWNLSIFSPYFSPKMQLYTSCFYQPNCQDKEACSAFDPENRYNMQPGRWVAVYRALVQAPATGRFRFVGVADSLMVVRFDGKNVLVCGLHDVENNKWNEWSLLANPGQKSMRELYAYKNCEAWNMQVGGFTPGKEFSVKEGQWYEMQVLVSEIGGGDYGFCLLVDEMDKPNKPRTREGLPIFQLFRTARSAPTAEAAYKAIKYKDESNITDPPYDPDSRVWLAKPVGPEVKMK